MGWYQDKGIEHQCRNWPLKEGVAAAPVFATFTSRARRHRDPALFMDQAAFKAGIEGSVI